MTTSGTTQVGTPLRGLQSTATVSSNPNQVPIIKPFPKEWIDPKDAAAESPSMDQLEAHVTIPALQHPSNFPFKDARFDEVMPRSVFIARIVEPELLRFLGESPNAN